MSDFFLGEIRMFSFGIVPSGWHLCDGKLLSIRENNALYSLIGTQFGGDGSNTFGLPDLRGRAPLGTQNPGRQQGLSFIGGSETVTATTNQIPAHIHTMAAIANTPGDKPIPAGNFYAKVTPMPPATAPVNIYGTPATENLVSLDPGTLDGAGNSAAHPNMQPFLAGNYCIAITGLYPIRS